MSSKLICGEAQYLDWYDDDQAYTVSSSEDVTSRAETANGGDAETLSPKRIVSRPEPQVPRLCSG